MKTETNLLSKEKISNTQRIAVSGVVIALYAVLMYFAQGFAFGQYQIRIATALYALNGAMPFLIVPLGIANMLSNTLMGGMGIYDIGGGFLVGVVTGAAVYLIKKLKLNDWFAAAPLVLGPGFIVPIWLSKILNIPYSALAISLCIGQIVPAILGVIILKQVKNRSMF